MLKKLLYDSNKNKNDLDNALNTEINSKPSTDFMARMKLVYDSDWVVCELKKFNEAISTTEGELLPEQAKYEFSYEMNLPESNLQFLKNEVVAKTVPEQNIQGVGEFIFTSLREIVLYVYQWQGVLQLIASAGTRLDLLPLGATGPIGSLPAPTLTKPPPQSAYSQEVIYTDAYFSAGSGSSHTCNADGTYLTDIDTSLADFLVQYRINWRIPDENDVSVLWTMREYVDFIPGQWFYPPFDDDTIDWEFPNGTSDDQDEDSTPTYPDQYWEAQLILTFNGFMQADGASWGYPGGAGMEDKYDYVYDIFKSWYPDENSIITPFDAGSPYYAYRLIYNNIVKSCIQQVVINKLEEEKFQIDVTGYFLLLSPATRETSWSDPNFPTYEPAGEDMEARLKVYLRPTLKSIVTNKYT